MKKLKKWDPIIVIAWNHKWTKSSIVKIENDRVFLHDVNKVKKAVKWQGFVEKEASLHISNISYYDESSKKATRIGIQFDEKKGKKVRISRKTWNVLTENSKKA